MVSFFGGPPFRPDLPFSMRPFQAFFILAETFASTHLPRAPRTIPGAGAISESEPVVGLAFVVVLALGARLVVPMSSEACWDWAFETSPVGPLGVGFSDFVGAGVVRLSGFAVSIPSLIHLVNLEVWL